LRSWQRILSKRSTAVTVARAARASSFLPSPPIPPGDFRRRRNSSAHQLLKLPPCCFLRCPSSVPPRVSQPLSQSAFVPAWQTAAEFQTPSFLQRLSHALQPFAHSLPDVAIFCPDFVAPCARPNVCQSGPQFRSNCRCQHRLLASFCEDAAVPAKATIPATTITTPSSTLPFIPSPGHPGKRARALLETRTGPPAEIRTKEEAGRFARSLQAFIQSSV